MIYSRYITARSVISFLGYIISSAETDIIEKLVLRLVFFELPGFAVPAGLNRRSGHPPVRKVHSPETTADAGPPGTASRRMPVARLHLLSRIMLRLNKFASLRACASSSLAACRRLLRRRHGRSSLASQAPRGYASRLRRSAFGRLRRPPHKSIKPEFFYAYRKCR